MTITLDTPVAVATMTGVRVKHVEISDGKEDHEKSVRIVAHGIDSNGDFVPGAPFVLVATPTGSMASRGSGPSTPVPSITFATLVNSAAPNGFRRRAVNAIRVAFNLQGTEA